MDVTLLRKRIFDSDPYLAELNTTSQSCEKRKDGFAVTFLQTIFFPRGGGQPCEGGQINGMEVIDVFEENGEILHILPHEINPHEPSHMKISFDKRFGHMQHHLAQHILSALVTKLFQIDTASAGIEHDGGHIELPRSLSPSELSLLELEANKAVNSNIPVKTSYHTPEDASSFTVRGKITPHQMIRLVEINGFDINACGGTHCRTTGEIESIVITGTKEVRGLFRIYFKAGASAKHELEGRTEHLIEMQQATLCEDISSLSRSVKKLVDTLGVFEEQNRRLSQRLIESDSERLTLLGSAAGERLFISQIIKSSDTKHYKAVGELITSSQKATVLLALKGESDISLIFIQSKGVSSPDLGSYIKNIAQAFGGKGGGSPVLAQGMIPFSEEAILMIKKIIEDIRKELL
ncbi:MAG: hypothetical protein VB078_01595 [Clostridiaceae bacterium]|nr:hypothetical protein [Clostridiaceae bacterium]